MSSRVPLIRDLQRCRRSDFAEATKEVIGTVLLAILPVWLGAGLLMLIPRASIGPYIGEFLGSGEALLVSAALIGPSIYIITKKYGDLPKSLTIHFPQGWFLVILWLSICMVITAIFGLQRIYTQVAPNSHEPLFDLPLMQRLSAFILVITIVSLYIVTVFKNFAEEGAAVEMHSDTADFLKEWEEDDDGTIPH
jgi:hypothetical protein